jgi:hypothetical protein
LHRCKQKLTIFAQFLSQNPINHQPSATITPTNLLLIHSVVSNDNRHLESLETSVLAKNKKKHWLKRKVEKAAANSVIVRKKAETDFSETDFYQRFESLGVGHLVHVGFGLRL